MFHKKTKKSSPLISVAGTQYRRKYSKSDPRSQGYGKCHSLFLMKSIKSLVQHRWWSKVQISLQPALSMERWATTSRWIPCLEECLARRFSGRRKSQCPPAAAKILQIPLWKTQCQSCQMERRLIIRSNTFHNVAKPGYWLLADNKGYLAARYPVTVHAKNIE